MIKCAVRSSVAVCLTIFSGGVVCAGGESAWGGLQSVCCGDDKSLAQMVGSVSSAHAFVDCDGECPGDSYQIFVAPEQDERGFLRRITQTVGIPVRGVRFLLSFLWYYAQQRVPSRGMTEEEQLAYILTDGIYF